MTPIFLALTLACVPALEIGVETAAPTRLPLQADARFTVTYWHSMYDAPLTEEFVVAGAEKIRLVKIRSDNAGVREYLAIEDSETEHARDREFSSISFLIATKKPQVLGIGAQTWSFRDFGKPGARVSFHPAKDCDR